MDCVPAMLQALQAGPEGRFDPEKREQLLQASSIAGMVIAQTGTTVVHSMGYSLTYFKDIDHGKANGLLLGEYLRFVEKVQPDLTERILGAMNLSGVDSFQNLMNSLLERKEGISSAEISQYSKKAIQAKNISNCVVKPKEEDIRRMFEHSFVK